MKISSHLSERESNFCNFMTRRTSSRTIQTIHRFGDHHVEKWECEVYRQVKSRLCLILLNLFITAHSINFAKALLNYLSTTGTTHLQVPWVYANIQNPSWWYWMSAEYMYLLWWGQNWFLKGLILVSLRVEQISSNFCDIHSNTTM